MNRPLHSRNRLPPAFTLIELMVVIALIAIMTAVILPEMSGTFQDALLRSSARKLVDVLSLANSRAITLSQVHRVRFEETNRRYVLERRGRDGEQAFVPVDLSGAKGALDEKIQLSIRKSDEPTEADATPEASFTTADHDIISFYPDGTADAGEIRLRDRSGFNLALRINPITGRVHVTHQEEP